MFITITALVSGVLNDNCCDDSYDSDKISFPFNYTMERYDINIFLL